MSEISEQKQNRIYGIDLLRLVSMLMVCTIHVMSELCVLEGKGAVYYERGFILAICSCAVNCFAIISGYVGVGSKYKLSRLAMLWLTVVFYTVSLTAVCCLINHGFQFEQAVKAFLPAISEQYWYFSAYFLAFFFFPLANAFCKNTDGIAKICFFIAVALMSVVGLRLAAFQDLWSMNSGYSAFWLLVMYCLGGLMKCGFPNISKKTGVLLFSACVLITWGFEVAADFVSLPESILPHGALFGYTSPTMIIAAVALVSVFTKINVGEKSVAVLKKLSPLAFSVYIIHYNKNLWGIFTSKISFNGEYFLLDAMAFVGALYVCCIIVDALRNALFKAIKVNKLCGKLDAVADRISARVAAKK